MQLIPSVDNARKISLAATLAADVVVSGPAATEAASAANATRIHAAVLTALG